MPRGRLLLRTPTSVPWAITFTNPLAAANVGRREHPLHPTQLYEAAPSC
jgi:prolipoprotein diacylglyceryltransferase